MPARAETTELDPLRNALDKPIKNLVSASSIEFTAKFKGMEGFAKDAAPEFLLNMRETSDGYYYFEQTTLAPPDRAGNKMITAYDGTHFYEFSASKGSLLSIYKQQPKIIESLNLGVYPLKWLQFFKSLEPENTKNYLSLSNLKNEGLFDLSLNKFQLYSEPSEKDNSIVCYKVDGGQDTWNGLKFSYVVYLKNPDGENDFMRLVGWDKVDTENNVFYELRIKDYANVKINNGNIRFPTAYTERFVWRGSKKLGESESRGKTTYLYAVDVSGICFNREIECAVDPGLADIIYDAESKKTFTVPR
jgi:hypothetical protein